MHDLSDLLDYQLKSDGVTGYIREHRFHPERKWRFDLAFLSVRLAVEVDGGTWSGGRHTRSKGYERDCEKLNEAARLGWRVMRFTGDMVRDGRAAIAIRQFFSQAAQNG